LKTIFISIKPRQRILDGFGLRQPSADPVGEICGRRLAMMPHGGIDKFPIKIFNQRMVQPAIAVPSMRRSLVNLDHGFNGSALAWK